MKYFGLHLVYDSIIIGCAAYFWFRTRDWTANTTQAGGKIEQKVGGSAWF